MHFCEQGGGGCVRRDGVALPKRGGHPVWLPKPHSVGVWRRFARQQWL